MPGRTVLDPGSAAAVLLSALLLASCQRPPATPVAPRTAPDLAAQPAVARAHWRVGTTGDYAPFSIRSADGQPAGFDIEVVSAMAQDLKADLEWVSVRWPTLRASLEANAFDVAMSGVTWQPTRDVIGYMTRAMARGGPCVLGDAHGTPVAVNQGGVLEKWARSRWPEAALVVVDDNQSLPDLLAGGRVRAIVTDSFELHAFSRSGWASECEPKLARKVYWVAPGHAALARAIDGWLETHVERVQAAQERWFGERQPLRAIDHLSDLLARRLAFMPLVAAAKAQAGLPIEDLARERQVLDASVESARRRGLPEARMRDFFALQIALAKAVQSRKSEASTLDLGREIRPALNDLGERIIDAVAAAARTEQLRTATLEDLAPILPWLEPGERERLLAAMRGLGG
jgi:cyclohexadienyl dehydratase